MEVSKRGSTPKNVQFSLIICAEINVQVVQASPVARVSFRSLRIQNLFSYSATITQRPRAVVLVAKRVLELRNLKIQNFESDSVTVKFKNHELSDKT